MNTNKLRLKRVVDDLATYLEIAIEKYSDKILSKVWKNALTQIKDDIEVQAKLIDKEESELVERNIKARSFKDKVNDKIVYIYQNVRVETVRKGITDDSTNVGIENINRISFVLLALKDRDTFLKNSSVLENAYTILYGKTNRILEEYTNFNLLRISQVDFVSHFNHSVQIKLDNLYVEREIEKEIFGLLSSNISTLNLVIGDAGMGKTSLLWGIFQKIINDSELDLIYLLDSQNLLKEEVRKELSEDVHQSIILIDTLDSISFDVSIKLILESCIKNGNRIIITSRPSEASYFTNQLDYVINKFHIKKYNEEEYRIAVENYSKVYNHFYNEYYTALNFDDAKFKNISEIAKNPLTLRMLFSIHYPKMLKGSHINEKTLYTRYWENKVKGDIRMYTPVDIDMRKLQFDSEDCSKLVHLISLLMLKEKGLSISRNIIDSYLVSIELPSNHLNLLKSRGVIREVNNEISFFHQTLYEYALSNYILKYTAYEKFHHLFFRFESLDYFHYNSIEFYLIDSLNQDKVEGIAAIKKVLAYRTDDSLELCTNVYMFVDSRRKKRLFRELSESLITETKQLIFFERMKSSSIYEYNIILENVKLLWNSDEHRKVNKLIHYLISIIPVIDDKKFIIKFIDEILLIDEVISHSYQKSSEDYLYIVDLISSFVDIDIKWVMSQLIKIFRCETKIKATHSKILYSIVQNRQCFSTLAAPDYLMKNLIGESEKLWREYDFELIFYSNFSKLWDSSPEELLNDIDQLVHSSEKLNKPTEFIIDTMFIVIGNHLIKYPDKIELFNQFYSNILMSKILGIKFASHIIPMVLNNTSSSTKVFKKLIELLAILINENRNKHIIKNFFWNKKYVINLDSYRCLLPKLIVDKVLLENSNREKIISLLYVFRSINSKNVLELGKKGLNVSQIVEYALEFCSLYKIFDINTQDILIQTDDKIQFVRAINKYSFELDKLKDSDSGIKFSIEILFNITEYDNSFLVDLLIFVKKVQTFIDIDLSVYDFLVEGAKRSKLESNKTLLLEALIDSKNVKITETLLSQFYEMLPNKEVANKRRFLRAYYLLVTSNETYVTEKYKEISKGYFKEVEFVLNKESFEIVKRILSILEKTDSHNNLYDFLLNLLELLNSTKNVSKTLINSLNNNNLFVKCIYKVIGLLNGIKIIQLLKVNFPKLSHEVEIEMSELESHGFEFDYESCIELLRVKV